MPFHSPEELAEGLYSKQVDSVLIDTNIASYRKDLFNESWCTPEKEISYPFAVGIILRNDGEKLQKLFEKYLKQNQAKLFRSLHELGERSSVPSVEKVFYRRTSLPGIFPMWLTKKT